MHHRLILAILAPLALGACDATEGDAGGGDPLGIGTPALAATTSETPDSDPWQRADGSFSPQRIETAVPPESFGRLANPDWCAMEPDQCEWADENGVIHVYGGDVIAIKSVHIAPADTRDLRALGIGTARQKPEVVAAVARFLPEIAMDCTPAGESGEGDGRSSCGGNFAGGGWYKLVFDADDRLVEARIDAFQIN